MKKDYYEILGVAKDATTQQIKKKYRSLALKYHPDRVKTEEKAAAEERFKEISEAYGVLSDPKKRQMYDQYGHAGIDQNFTADDIFGGADFSSVFGEAGLGDIFSQIFGGGGGGGGGGFDFFGGGGGHAQRRQRGRDIQYEVDITFEEAFSGVKKKIRVPRNEYCTTCSGTGAKNGTSLDTCGTCHGSGYVTTSSGFFRMQQGCPACGGRGKVIKEFCDKCQGKGMQRITRNVEINIPAGVDNNSRLRVRDEGEIGKDGPGDLYLYIHVLPSDTYQRDGNDLYMDLPLLFTKSALGGEVSVPTLNGKVTMKIPQGTQSGKVFRLKEKGMPDVHHKTHKGDLYVKVMLHVPSKLNAEQQELIEQFAKISGDSINHKGESIKDKIKKVFK